MNTTENLAPAAYTKLGFPVQECTRCQGRGFMGEYEYVDAGRCFKCAGSGKMLTRKGAAAYKLYLAALDQAAKKPASEFKEGDRVRIRTAYGTITKITYTDHKAFKTTDGKEWPATTSVNFHFANSRCNFTCNSDMDLTTDQGIDPAEFTKGL